ncbi:MAG: diphthine--ammonia ligase, partial [Crenarchaeota archaeon]|nr:diphthine--ammonia ligase [Thermoproteota archaeon]
YEEKFKQILQEFKQKGVEGLITGDIYEVANHEKHWLERVCEEVGLIPIRPLWQLDTKKIFKDYILEGFKSTVVRTKLSALDEKWLGRELNQQFYNDIQKYPQVDPCGEGGEYHTVVTDGPNFKNAIKLIKTQISTTSQYGHLDILQFDVVPKQLR